MILGFKQQFQDKTPTNFREKILSGEKIHSIRAGDRWRLGMSIQMAYGVRTINYDQFNAIGWPELERCKNVQRIQIAFMYGFLEVRIDGENWDNVHFLMINDGLTRNQFIDWFFPKGVHEFSGQIIHWTDFKY